MKVQNPDTRSSFYCSIKFKNHLDNCWLDWFDGLLIKTLDYGEVVVSGPVQDQAALFGLLNKIRDLNLKVLSLNVRARKEA